MESVAPVSNQEKASMITRVLSAAGVLLGAVGVSVVAYFDPVTAGFFPLCPFYAMTGFYCPGCGLTRGFHALFHGDLASALHFNALLPFYFFVLAYMGISMFLVSARGRGLSFGALKPKFLYGFMVIFVVFTLVRNLPFYPFTYLAP